jgi:Tfp pilus assembly protein PilF
MNYFDALKKALNKYQWLDDEDGYWNFVTDSHVAELFHNINLSQILYQYREHWKSSKELLLFFEAFLNWSGSVEVLKAKFDPQSNNLFSFFNSANTLQLYSKLLCCEKLTQRLLFQYCIILSGQKSGETRDNALKNASSTTFFSPDISRKDIKTAWKSIQQFLSFFHPIVIQTGPKRFFSRVTPIKYFQHFSQSKNIAFPAVFIRRGKMSLAFIEECKFWFDIQLETETTSRKKITLISLNSAVVNDQYEDRVIGAAIEKAVTEAVNYYQSYFSPGSRSQTIKTVFFQIGNVFQNYDGDSIACAVFITTLTRLTGRHLITDTLQTGKLGCSDNGIEGVIEKAEKGWESGFRSIIIPQENQKELTTWLKTKNGKYQLKVYSYKSINELFNIWDQLTALNYSSVESPVTKANNLAYRNKYFTGRDKILESLRKKFSSGVPIVVLSGLGGVGKTEISNEYAYRYQAFYPLIWRIRGEELSTMIIDYSRLAHKLNLPQKNTHEEDVILDAVKAWLENHSGWLLIFDNVETPQVLFNDDLAILPRGGKGHIVITTRFHDWNEWCDHITIKKFSIEDAIDFLLKRTQQKNRRIAKQLAQKVGQLPLALAQMAAYIKKEGMVLENYLVLYEKERKLLWEVENAPRNYPYTVATTWKIAMDRVRHQYPMAVDLLNFLALFASEDIPVEFLFKDEVPNSEWEQVKNANKKAAKIYEKRTLKILKDYFQFRSKSNHPNQIISLAGHIDKSFIIREAIETLKYYSLVNGNIQSLSVHNLVQLVTRDAMDLSQLPLWIESSLGLLERLFPEKSSDLNQWPQCSQLFPHAVTISEMADQHHIRPEINIRLLKKIATYLFHAAQFSEAASTYQKGYQIAKTIYTPPHAELSNYLKSIGQCREAQDHFKQALNFYQQALNYDRRLSNNKAVNIAETLNHLGAVSLKQGKLDDALSYFQNALENYHIKYSQRHPSSAVCRTAIGKTFAARGNLEEAFKHYENALQIAKECYGNEHTFVAEIVNNIGDANLLRGDLKSAEEDFKLAYQINHKCFGKEHPVVAADLNRMGSVALQRKDYSLAENLFHQSAEINSKIYGNNHHSIARDNNSFGCLEKEKGNLLLALDHFKKALLIAKSVYKTIQHPFIAIVADNYGYTKLELKTYSEARKYIELALSINRKSYRSTHPLVARSLNSLARVYHLEGKLDLAQKYYFNAYDILFKKFGKNHPDILETRKNLLHLADQLNQEDAQANNPKNRLFSLKADAIYKKLNLSINSI